MAVFLIATPLQKFTDGEQRIEISAESLEEGLEKMDMRYKGFKAKLISPSGEIFKFVNIFVDGESVKTKKNLKTPLLKSSKVNIHVALAGG